MDLLPVSYPTTITYNTPATLFTYKHYSHSCLLYVKPTLSSYLFLSWYNSSTLFVIVSLDIPTYSSFVPFPTHGTISSSYVIYSVYHFCWPFIYMWHLHHSTIYTLFYYFIKCSFGWHFSPPTYIACVLLNTPPPTFFS